MEGVGLLWGVGGGGWGCCRGAELGMGLCVCAGVGESGGTGG
jgi:hypothetical protein